VGTGAAAKISQNTILSGTLVATSEGFALAKACGIDVEAFQRLIRVSAAQSHIADNWLETWAIRVMPNAYQHTLDTALAMAEEKGLELPAATLTRELIPKVLGPREL
jgi:3-hydroxyisobutyrate dehydrogenase-like beta-hydroxyacid dehydrogenase